MATFRHRASQASGFLEGLKVVDTWFVAGPSFKGSLKVSGGPNPRFENHPTDATCVRNSTDMGNFPDLVSATKVEKDRLLSGKNTVAHHAAKVSKLAFKCKIFILHLQPRRCDGS